MRTMTVSDLIELLSQQDPETKVIFESDYGDYHHTRQALPLNGELETVIIHKSAYSNSGFAIVPAGQMEYGAVLITTSHREDEEDSYDEYLVIR